MTEQGKCFRRYEKPISRNFERRKSDIFSRGITFCNSLFFKRYTNQIPTGCINNTICIQEKYNLSDFLFLFWHPCLIYNFLNLTLCWCCEFSVAPSGLSCNGLFFPGVEAPGYITPPFSRAFPIFVYSSAFSLTLSPQPLSQLRLPVSLTYFQGTSWQKSIDM
jgi:hypothetical protein